MLTSYIMTAAITMPLSGWLATRFGLKSVFMISIVGVHPRLGTLRRTGASPSVFFALVRQMIAVVRFWSSLDSPLEGALREKGTVARKFQKLQENPVDSGPIGLGLQCRLLRRYRPSYLPGLPPLFSGFILIASKSRALPVLMQGS